MPFRDDDEARLARISSLENENEDLREELEIERRKAAELAAAREKLEHERRETAAQLERLTDARQPASRELEPRVNQERRTRKPGFRPSRAVTVTSVLGVVCVVGLIVHCMTRTTQRTGTISRLIWVEGVLAVQIEHHHRRGPSTIELVNFDLATGTRVGSVDLGAVEQVRYPRPGERVFIEHDHRLALLDLRKPGLVVSADELPARIPELAGGYLIGDRSIGSLALGDGSISDDNMWYRTSVPVALADGSKAWLDTTPRLHREQPVEEPTYRVGYACMYYDAPSCEQRRCYAWGDVTGSTAKQLGWFAGWRTRIDEMPALASAEAARLHDPVFVKRLDRGCALELDGGVLVLHQTSPLDPTRPLLSLLDAAGAIRWTLPIADLAEEGLVPIRAQLASGVIQVLLTDQQRPHEAKKLSATVLQLVHISRDGKVLAKHRLW